MGKDDSPQSNDRIIAWLLDSDPSIRWQVMRDLLNAPPAAVAVERRRVATEGWGARLLGLQEPDGNWGGGAWAFESWASTMETLMLLRELGLDAASPEARRAVTLVREKSNWGEYHRYSPFFEGEEEPCINGRVLACGAYFGVASDRLADRLLGEQLPDGGWNCDAPPSEHSSFNTTLCVLEGLLEYEHAIGDGGPIGTGFEGGARPDDVRRAVRAALIRGREYLIERSLFRSLTTGGVIERDRKSGCDWRALSFPTRWHYDILWALDFLRRAGVPRDERMAEAVALVAGKRQRDGRWLLEHIHPGKTHFEMEGGAGVESRWITLRAMRVLARYSG